ncbi:MAG: transcription-repair coupling factor, partial [Betaproteobacteria bacterium]|nr:transcription-repair coupling factor [Betaproteobacteria bacterium]
MNAPDTPTEGLEPAPGASAALPGSSDALAVARLARMARPNAGATPLMVICARPTDAQRLQEEAGWIDPALRVTLFPDWETLPYDGFSPHGDLISERLATLHRIRQREFDVLIVPATTALTRVAPPAFLAAYTFFLKQGEPLSIDRLRAQLTLGGYSHVSQVVAPGEYCVRGGLVDLFPMGSSLPFRIELMDQDIESIRTFDADTQRTIYKVNDVRLLPAREFPTDDNARAQFRARFREAFEGDPSKSNIYKDVSNGITPPGIEYFLPLFFDEVATLFDYLPAGTRIALHGDIQAEITEFWRDTQSRYRLLSGDRTRPVLPPDALYLGAEAFFLEARRFERLALDGSTLRAFGIPEVSVERRAADPLHRLKAFLAVQGSAQARQPAHDAAAGAAMPRRVLLLAESAGRR